MFDVIFDSALPHVSVLHRDAEEEAVVVETAGPEAVPLHAQESPPGHRRLPHTKEVKHRTRHRRKVQFFHVLQKIGRSQNGHSCKAVKYFPSSLYQYY